jgi:hypothetical protein
LLQQDCAPLQEIGKDRGCVFCIVLNFPSGLAGAQMKERKYLRVYEYKIAFLEF